MKKLLAGILSLVLVLSLTACGGNSGGAGSAGTASGTGDSGKKLVIAGKQYTEQVLLVHLLSELIEKNTDIQVDKKADLGATDVLMQGMKDGAIDLFVEYTGTGYMVVLKNELDTRDANEIYERTKQGYLDNHNITWLKPFQFNTTYAIAIKDEKAKELGIETLSDFAKHSANFVLGSEYDFLEREDGIKGFNETYGIQWKEVKGMDRGLTYDALNNGAVDAVVAFATDGRLPRFNLKVLKDDKHYFPPYYGAPIIRTEVLNKYPELEELLAKLVPYLTDETMAELNSKVDIDKQPEEEVAHNFLMVNGLIKN